MDTIRAVFIGLEGEALEERVIRYPPPATIMVAFSKPLQRVWEEGPGHVEVPFDYHHAHEIHDDGVETVALYVRRGIC